MPPPLQDPGGRRVGGLTPPGQTAGLGDTQRSGIQTNYERNDTGLWIGFALAFLIIAALGVLFLLPEAVKETPSVTTSNATEATPKTTSRTPAQATKPQPTQTKTPAAQTDQNEQKLRLELEEVLTEVLTLRAELELESANIWAEKDWNALENDKKVADQHMDENRIAEAIKQYEWMRDGYQLINKKRQDYVMQHLAAGSEAFLADDAETAISAFEKALAADPENPVAQLGLKRSEVLPKVLEQMRKAQEASEYGDVEQQIASLKTALEIDPYYKKAKKQLNAVVAEQEQLKFQTAMGEALQALDEGRLSDARKAVTEAGKIRPQDPAVAGIRQRLADASRTRRLSGNRAKAQSAEKKEDWAAAKAEYEKAAKIDATSAFAQDGLRRSKARLELHQQLDHYLKRPDRIHSPEPLANAERLIESAGEGSSKEPKLKAKIEKLKEEVRLAKIPVTVRIRSDGETEVTLLPVAKLGRFESKTMELRPGTYTLTGFRNGYVDARRVFKVQPGKRVPPLSIRCEEPID